MIFNFLSYTGYFKNNSAECIEKVKLTKIDFYSTSLI